MSALPILILHPRFDEDSQLLWQAALNRDWRVVRGGWDAFTLATELPDDGSPLVLYGGWEWVSAIVSASLAVFPLPSSPPDDQIVNLPYVLSKRWMKMEDPLGASGWPYPVFVKSVTGKELASKVYASDSELPTSMANPVIIQEPVRWRYEYRAFVNDRRVATISRYAVHGTPTVSPPESASETREWRDALAYAARISDALPSGAYVLDVGFIEGRGWAVVETNPAWCSGLYACDPSAALDVIAASCGVTA